MSKLLHPKAQEAALSQDGVATSSTSPPPYESPSSKFAIVSLNMMDRIRLIQFSSADIDRILEVIRATWEQGVQNTRPYNASFEIQLKGHPWIHSLHGNMKSRRLVRALLQALHELGWVYDASVSLCKKPDEKGEQSSLPSEQAANISRHVNLPQDNTSSAAARLVQYFIRPMAYFDCAGWANGYM